MASLAALLGLGCVLVGVMGLIGIICPMPRIGLANRKRALGMFFLSFIGFVIAMGISTELTQRGDVQGWQWVLFLLVAYGLFRLTRQGKQKEKGRKRSTKPSFKLSQSDDTPLSPSKTPPRTKDQPFPDAELSLENKATTISKSSTRWIEPGREATVAGRKIGGMIYLGSEPRQESWKREGRPFIDPSLPVAKVGSDFSGVGTSYWPSYRDIDSRARATYLDWLAGDRSDRRIGSGYIFLYFYGLEQRFFVDAPDEDEKRLLVTEAERLLEVYGEDHLTVASMRPGGRRGHFTRR